jgi:DNA-binding NtrC family response regulator
MEIQGKLLRVLEAKEYKPVGGSHIKKTDVRIIAATNQDLKAKVDKGDFREDLYYRLNIFPIFLPPLREREDDIPRLAYHFLRYFCRKTGKRISGFSDDALSVLVNNDWPGNVRQLKNAIERLVIMADDNFLDLFHMLNHLQINRNYMGDSIPDTLEKLKEQKKRILEESFGQIEKAFLIKTLRASDGNITHAAEKAGMKRPNFSALMKKHGLSNKSLRKNLDRGR